MRTPNTSPWAFPIAVTALALTTTLPACTCRGGETPAPTASSTSSAAPSASAALPERPRAPAPSRQGSVIARSAGNDALYIADEDASLLRVVPLPFDREKPARSVPLPGRPAQVLPLDGRVLVTLRDPGLLLILRPDSAGGLAEAARVALPADAWGIAITKDESTAIVTSAWTHAVSAVDLAGQRLRFTVDVGREPRGVAITQDGSRAYINHLVGDAVTRVDGIASEKPTIRRIPVPAGPLRTGSGQKTTASLGYAVALSPDDRRLYIARHALGVEALHVWYGAGSVDVLLTRDDTPLAPTRESPGLAEWNSYASITGQEDSTLSTPYAHLVQPRAMIYRPSTRTLFVASEGAGSITELDALAIDPSALALRITDLSEERDDPSAPSDKEPKPKTTVECGAPSGIALSADEQRLFVYCRSNSALAVVDAPTAEGGKRAVAVAPLAPPGADADAKLAEGKRLFYDATDDQVSGGMGCAGCHPDGRDDGFTWRELVDEEDRSRNTFFATLAGTSGFPRQTPMLAGRMASPGPYGWHAENATLLARLRAGFGLHRWEPFGNFVVKNQAQAEALAVFVRKGLVPPPRSEKEPTPEEKRGKELFASPAVGCATCHMGAEHTDRVAVSLPRMPWTEGAQAEPERNFKTPSLLFVGGTPPYFHDGSAATLEELIEQNDDRMGKTNQLSKEDKAALVAYLRTL